MKPYAVLVVDDSAVARAAVSRFIEEDPEFRLVGIARNGRDAIEKVERLRPDVVTMDIEMPEMDGIQALREIMARCPVPVVMLSHHTRHGAEMTLLSLECGAVDFFPKDWLMEATAGSLRHAKSFRDCLRTAAAANIVGLRNATPVSPDPPPKMSGGAIELVVIGCSTGGPAALQEILPQFSADEGPAVLVVQHMPPGFTKALAERFNSLCRMRVKEAEEGDIVRPGHIYIAPAGFQTVIELTSSGHKRVRVRDDLAVATSYKPSIDVTLQSAAPIYGERLLVAILTGMGNDGLAGCAAVKHHRGKVIAEAEETCVVYGMPRAVQEAGLADVQVPRGDIYRTIVGYSAAKGG
ncbi:MAG: chemotaxis response regulator protein-glutamate methylesterase [Candidatus Reconcilbacillus cellulovorans]|uniref:Protein-glutamate methylesterase/protein-glutamine glutaminase n=1 Tax=Candidatus Reconcilbacillus cellulovorans TaxID=1906605 RepID=A0A2A6DYS1_9BACL|nr:MAG: chemotaxis response regulator protein-glutamate methylesterase [Candidatus Reconcilbacillus cellulovorans]